MVEHRILHAAGLARLLGVLVLLAGIVAMHSAVFALPGHVHPPGAHAAPETAAEPRQASAVPVGSTHHAVGSDGTHSHHPSTAFSPHDGTATNHDPHTEDRTRTRNGFGAAVADGSRVAYAVMDGLGTGAGTVASVLPAGDLPCAGGGCDGAHGGLHGCVFILAALIALATLVLLHRVAADRPGNGATRPRHWRPRRERPPPWTVLTLAELAILRI
ncbi:hypothetical protein ACRS6B_11875 [Nocardia asteroides]